MINITDELKAKLLAAASAEEAVGLVKAAGQEITAEDAARLWDKIEATRKESLREFSPDELEAVSGGADRDWLQVGCAATVEPNSWCGCDDWCEIWDVSYVNSPARVCPHCGGMQIFKGVVNNRVPGHAQSEEAFWCSSCGVIDYVTDNHLPNGI